MSVAMGSLGNWVWDRLLDNLARPRTATLESTGLVLQPPRHMDHAAWASLRASSRNFLQPYEPLWPEDDLLPAAWYRRLARYRRDSALKLGHVWLIWRKDGTDKVLVGGISLTGLRHGVMQAATIGYWIGAPFVRQGIASEAVRLVINHASRDLGLGRVEAATLPDNEPSIRLLRKLGFEEEGRAKNYLRINGVWKDHTLFALTQRENMCAASRNAAAKGPQSFVATAVASARQR
ncbi:MAG: GNAT family protein [Pseudomonadota bacterium]